MRNVEFSEEDDCFICTDSNYPGCSAFGENPEEAISEFHHAVIAWIDAQIAAGNIERS